MSNAAKHRKKAAEFEQLKQIDRAIASYVKAIEESESAGEDVDVALYNKVGDLALRQGRVPDAITYYERAVEHYATSGLFNNAIALCNKILRNAPGRANVYFTLGRISARKGLRGDATRNFLEYATRMQQEGRIEEGIRALAEVLDIMPELNDVRTMVEDLATRAGIALPRRRTPLKSDSVPTPASNAVVRDRKSQDLVFLDIDYGEPARRTPARTAKVPTPVAPLAGLEQPSVAASPAGQRPLTPAPGLPMLDTGDPLQVIEIEPTAPTPDTLSAEPSVEPLADLAPTAAVDAAAEPVAAADGAPLTDLAPTLVIEPLVEAAVDESPAALIAPGLLEGLEANGEFTEGAGTLPLDGFTPDEELSTADAVDPAVHATDVTWIIPVEDETSAVPLDDVASEDFADATNDPGVVRAIYSATPAYVPSIVPDAEIDDQPLEIERLDVESVPELDEASAAGQELVARAELEAERTPARRTPPPMVLTPILPMAIVDVAPVAPVAQTVPQAPAEALVNTHGLAHGGVDAPLTNLAGVEEQLAPTRPPFRLDPHDFILPGELPPLLLDDAFVESGLATMGQGASAGDTAPGVSTRETVASAIDTLQRTPVGDLPAVAATAEGTATPPATIRPPTPRAAVPAVTPSSLPSLDSMDLGDAMADEEFLEDTDESLEPTVGRRSVSVTPSLPIAAVAEAATTVASSRRDSLRAAVARLPKNWLLRRRLAEALFEAGERDAALHELETAQQGLVNDGEFGAASDIADELVHVSPDRVAFHQKRVELAVRSNDQQRLRFAYLDLADALVRLGEEGRARAVYARVLEIDPYDDRARAALGAAAPPPPPPAAAARPDDSFVDLADWLRDEDHPNDTRMRMREPAISGDEQADFDALLRHFKEGVSRSLGEDDFESHYDLGVAYKEMGLLDDAIAEFQKALRSRAHRLPAYEALGQCFVEQERFQVAATVLSRALHEPGLDDDQRVGVLYLLAYSCEALQRRDEARSYFQRVYATDINFRDVAARLAALEQAPR